MATPKKTDPLTPAQVEVLKQLIEDRQATVTAHVQDAIEAAVAPLAAELEQVKAQLADAIKYGDKIALRMASGQALCADEGGPSEPNAPVSFSSRENVAAHESFGTERGQ